MSKCKSYNDAISTNQKSNQQQGQKDKRVLVVDDEYDITLAIKVVLEGFKVDSSNEASKALENFSTGLKH